MVALLLFLVLLGQGIPLPQGESGIITGTLKADDGKPAAGVRVAVLAVPEKVADISYATAMTSQGETDKDGHFRLENIPPGRYYITAGRVDYPTYFPGTQEITGGKIVTVKAGDRLDGFDFAMNAVATRPADAFGFGAITVSYVPSARVTFKMSVDGGGALPVFSPSGSFTSVRLVGVTDKKEYRVALAEVATKGVSIQQQAGTAPTEYRVVFDNLPEGFTAQSIRTGNVDLSKETLKIPPTSASATATIITPATAPTAASSTASSLQIQLQSYLSALATVSANTASTPGPQFEIQIILKKTPRPSSKGVRVSGRISNTEPRSVYLSGKPGTLYADGTFEFFDVVPGRHNITTPDNPTTTLPQGACIVAGNQDLDGIQLVETPMLPLNVLTPTEPGPAGTHSPGVLPLARFSGRVLDEMTHEPIPDAVVFLSGHYGKSYHTDADGKFESTQLLPGTYSLEIQTFAHATIRQTINVAETDIDMSFNTEPLN